MIKEIFEYQDYRLFLVDYFKSLPKEGYGQLTKAAKHLNVQPSLLTCILNGSKNMTIEQAFDFGEFASFSELESEYFINLVQYSRAGNQRMKDYFFIKLKDLKAKSSVIKNRLPPKKELDENTKALFYSDWSYSAIRMATSITELNTIESLVEKFKLPRQQVIKILDFLLENGLVIEENKKYKMGPQSTHVGSGEMLVSRHHTNWRLKAIEQIGKNDSDSLHFTSPLSISVADAVVVKKLLIKNIDQVFDVVDPSPAEQLAVLNIDWFKI